jgi:hypothetical protein
MSRHLVWRGALGLWLIGAGVNAPGVRAQTAERIDRASTTVVNPLDAKADLEALNVPLEDFLKKVAKEYGLTIRIDRNGFKRAGVAPSIPITASFKQVPLELALVQILRPLKLRARIADGIVVIEDLGLPLDAAHPPGIGPVGPQRVQVEVQRRFAAPVAAVRMGGPRLVRQNNDEMIRQQLRLVLQVELHFLKSVCAPTFDQFRQIKHQALKDIVGQEGDFRNQNVNSALDGARRTVQQKLKKLARAHLSAEQIKRYETEVNLRNANLRRVCARNLVVTLDEELSLTESQRQRLYSVLANNWDDAWTMTAVMTTNNIGFVPNIPDELIVPYLDAAQRPLWNTVSKSILGNGMPALFLGAGPPAPRNED